MVVAVTFDTTFSNRSLRNLLLHTAGSYAHLITTLTPGCLPVGSAVGWPEPTILEEGSLPCYSTHTTHNTTTVPAGLDTLRIPRHQNIAAWSKDTKFILFTEHAPAKALAVPVDRIHPDDDAGDMPELINLSSDDDEHGSDTPGPPVICRMGCGRPGWNQSDRRADICCAECYGGNGHSRMCDARHGMHPDHGPAALGRAQHASVLRLRPVEHGGQPPDDHPWPC